MAYLDLPEFRDLTIWSAAGVDRVQVAYPGWIDRQLAFHSDRFDSRLRKRYAVPFAAPTPLTIQAWLCAVLTPLVMLKGGMATGDELFVAAQAAATDAEKQLTEAADSEKGLFELPLRADLAIGGVTQGAPKSYSETSPYVWRDLQADAGRAEDGSGGGTFR